MQIKPAKFRFVEPGWKKIKTPGPQHVGESQARTSQLGNMLDAPGPQHVGESQARMSQPGGARTDVYHFITKARTCGRLLYACISAPFTQLRSGKPLLEYTEYQ